ncbi:MAG TPA: SPFH domain-containing protein [Gemmatimonadales bacterium]|nr:SPFH domain-containing protein [Gemmatimonadales bacterium]
MFGYMKAPPTTYVLHYRRGKLRREGPGLAFFYFAPTSTIVTVPLASADLPFVFTEVTADFQTVTLQGQLTYRVADPKRLAGLLDFSIRPNGAYVSDDPTKLPERLVQATQVLARDFVHERPLREALGSAEALVAAVRDGLRNDNAVTMLGVEVLGLSLVGITPTPETARALEADVRESLLRQSDEAIYARRNAAVEQERRIKESELNTEIAVQEKQRQIRETLMAADIAVEQQRTALIERRAANDRQDADARGYALQTTLEPLRTIDWRTLMAVSATGADPKLMIALAFRELAENAGKIGELNVTPDLLKSLLAPAPGGGGK